jgi:hypothetical protein
MEIGKFLIAYQNWRAENYVCIAWRSCDPNTRLELIVCGSLVTQASYCYLHCIQNWALWAVWWLFQVHTSVRNSQLSLTRRLKISCSHWVSDREVEFSWTVLRKSRTS